MGKSDRELNKILKKGLSKEKPVKLTERKRGFDVEAGHKEDKHVKYNQWTTSDDLNYFPAGLTRKSLPPGVYEIMNSDTLGIFFQRIKVNLHNLIRFPDSNSNRVIREIRRFWEKKEIFEEHDILYKRGICLWGPPGSGKTCTIQFIMKDVIGLGGVVFKFGNPNIFSHGIRIFREIQSDTPVVVLMEDIDGILEMYNESVVLNLLDGVDNVENVVFLATTNYPEKLGARIINRPSRFDKRFKIGHPSAESRKIYFEHIFKNGELAQVDLDDWVTDTDGMSIAHLKELYVAVMVIGDEYDEAIETLRSMSDTVSSSYDTENRVGFLID